MFKKLEDAIIHMREKEALEIAKRLVDEHDRPMDILESCTKSMEIVGKRFESGHYFLPELIMAGEMLKQISEMVKPKIKGKGESAFQKHGQVLIGTVEGDIHDIGKDIVAFLLDVNGFEVRDIGTDVHRQRFVEEIEDFKPQVVGMSGLLTVAYDSMKNTVQAIVKAGLRDSVKIMIGGGQMSDAVSQYTGADAYAEDAMKGVALARKWIIG